MVSSGSWNGWLHGLACHCWTRVLLLAHRWVEPYLRRSHCGIGVLVVDWVVALWLWNCDRLLMGRVSFWLGWLQCMAYFRAGVGLMWVGLDSGWLGEEPNVSVLLWWAKFWHSWLWDCVSSCFGIHTLVVENMFQGYCCSIGGQSQVPLSLAVGQALRVLDYRVGRTGPQSLAVGLCGSWAIARQPHWWVGLSLGTIKVEEDLKMLLTSTSVLVVEWGSPDCCCQSPFSQGESQLPLASQEGSLRSAGRSDPGFFQIIASTLGLRVWDFVCPLSMESLYFTVFWTSRKSCWSSKPNILVDCFPSDRALDWGVWYSP